MELIPVIGKSNNIAFFSQGQDWILDLKDPVAQKILKLVETVRLKTKMYEHKGTYRMRAWLVPPGANADLFGRRGI